MNPPINPSNKLKHHKGTPISDELKARTKAALKILTLDRFCRLGDISDTTVKRALAGDRIIPRCHRGLGRCCDLFEYWHGKEEGVASKNEEHRSTIRVIRWTEQPSTEEGRLGTVLDLIETWARRPQGGEMEIRMILSALRSMPSHDPSRRIERLIATCQ